MTDRELMQQALAALERAISDDKSYIAECKTSAGVLRARLKQPEPEPAAYCVIKNERVQGLVASKPTVMNAELWQPLYTAALQRGWQNLTDEEIISCLDRHTFKESLLAVQEKLRGKNDR